MDRILAILGGIALALTIWCCVLTAFFCTMDLLSTRRMRKSFRKLTEAMEDGKYPPLREIPPRGHFHWPSSGPNTEIKFMPLKNISGKRSKKD